MIFKFILANITLVVVLYGGYYYISQEESKSIFMMNLFSHVWFWVVAPIIGAGINMLLSISNEDMKIYYMITGGLYLSIFLGYILVDTIKTQINSSYYNKHVPVIKNEVDNYLKRMNLREIYDYTVVFGKNVCNNEVILLIKDESKFDEIEYLLYKEELEFLLKDYDIRIAKRSK